MERAFEIIKVISLGVMKIRCEEHRTGLIYSNKETAEIKTKMTFAFIMQNSMTNGREARFIP